MVMVKRRLEDEISPIFRALVAVKYSPALLDRASDAYGLAASMVWCSVGVGWDDLMMLWCGVFGKGNCQLPPRAQRTTPP